MINKIYAFSAEEITATQKKEVGTIYCLPITKISDKIVCNDIRRGIWTNQDGILAEVIHKRGKVQKLKTEDGKILYLVTDGFGLFAHGETVKKAKEALDFKLKDVDLTPYKKMKLTDKVAFKEALNLYHTITRACDIGTKMFVDSLPKKQIKKEYTIQEIIDITKGQYRSDVFADFFLKGE